MCSTCVHTHLQMYPYTQAITQKGSRRRKKSTYSHPLHIHNPIFYIYEIKSVFNGPVIYNPLRFVFINRFLSPFLIEPFPPFFIYISHRFYYYFYISSLSFGEKLKEKPFICFLICAFVDFTMY